MRTVAAPMAHVANKVAFITGGTSGIGLGIARAFVDAGMRVVITGNEDEHVHAALAAFAASDQSNKVHAIRVDVVDRRGMERAAAAAIDTFGAMHVLVNNAGVACSSPLTQTSYESWDSLMNVNITGVFNGVNTVLPYIKGQRDGGHVITTASVMGLFTLPGGKAGAYCVSKFAVVGMMEALRAELIESNIGVSVVCPGMVSSNTDHSMGPCEVGRLVLRGMRRNDMYILTHPEFAQVIKDRGEALNAAIPKDLQVTGTRLGMGSAVAENSIYLHRSEAEPVGSSAKSQAG